MDWYTALRVMHIIGTVLGAGSVTCSLLLYLDADPHQSTSPHGAALRVIHRLTDIGLMLLVFSGLGYLVYFRLTDQVAILYGSRLWAKYTVVGILLFGSIAQKYRKIPLSFWASLSIASWYTSLVLGIWRSLTASYPVIILAYVIGVACTHAWITAITRTKTQS